MSGESPGGFTPEVIDPSEEREKRKTEVMEYLRQLNEELDSLTHGHEMRDASKANPALRRIVADIGGKTMELLSVALALADVSDDEWRKFVGMKFGP